MSPPSGIHAPLDIETRLGAVEFSVIKLNWKLWLLIALTGGDLAWKIIAI